MTAVSAVEDTSGAPVPEASRAGRLRVWVLRITPYLVYAVFALAVTVRLWIRPDQRLVATNPTDHPQFLWFFSNAAYSLVHGENPLLTHRLNVPGEVNLMANTSMLGLAIPLAPVTLMFGPAVTFALAVAGGLAATAGTWYWLLRRHVVDSPTAAFVGGGFCGFAPGMIAQAAGHPNLVGQFLVPLIVWWVIRLREPGRAVRNGLVLALLVVYQVFINEEILLLTALACGVFLGWTALTRWREVRPVVRPFLSGLGVATAAAAVLLAYPLWFQFLGPAHYRGLPPTLDLFTADLASFPAFARRTVAGSAQVAQHLTLSANEEASFLGWPLLLFLAGTVVLLWRRALVRALVVTGVVFGVLALGPSITIYGHHTHIPAPLRVLRHVPPFDLATATRYALVVIPVVGVLLAVACAGLLRWSAADRRRQGLAVALVAAALLPLTPKPIQVIGRPVPAFITSGEWRQYVTGDRTLVPVPLPRYDQMDGMRWAALTKIGFPIPRGYFMGPDGTAAARSTWDPPLRPTSTLLLDVVRTGKVPAVTDADRAAALADLRYWRAAVVVALPAGPHAEALLTTVTGLLGPGRYDGAGGVWLWDVRPLTGG